MTIETEFNEWDKKITALDSNGYKIMVHDMNTEETEILDDVTDEQIEDFEYEVKNAIAYYNENKNYNVAFEQGY